MFIPKEIVDTIVFYVELQHRIDERDVVQPEKYHDPSLRRTLANLCLVNKTFHSSAAPRLFRRIRLTPDSTLDKVFLLSRSGRVRHVQEVHIIFDRPWHLESEYIIYLEDLVAIFPICLSKMRNLNTLNIQGLIFSPPQYTSPPPIAAKMAQTLSRMVVNALRYIPLPHLTDLHLALQVTAQFAQFFDGAPGRLRIPLETVMGRLRHLGIELCGLIDPEGRRFQPIEVPEAIRPPRVIQYEIPRAPLFTLVELAQNLDTLYIGSSTMMDIDGINMRGLFHLYSLYLSRVKISGENLTYLISSCRTTLRRIQFDGVWLNPGDYGKWYNVLDTISQLPLLEYLVINGPGYYTNPSTPSQPVMNGGDTQDRDRRDANSLTYAYNHVDNNRMAMGLPAFEREEAEV